MGYMGSYYNIPKAMFYLLKGDYIKFYKTCELTQKDASRLAG